VSEVASGNPFGRKEAATDLIGLCSGQIPSAAQQQLPRGNNFGANETEKLLRHEVDSSMRSKKKLKLKPETKHSKRRGTPAPSAKGRAGGALAHMDTSITKRTA